MKAHWWLSFGYYCKRFQNHHFFFIWVFIAKAKKFCIYFFKKLKLSDSQVHKHFLVAKLFATPWKTSNYWSHCSRTFPACKSIMIFGLFCWKKWYLIKGVTVVNATRHFFKPNCIAKITITNLPKTMAKNYFCPVRGLQNRGLIFYEHLACRTLICYTYITCISNQWRIFSTLKKGVRPQVQLEIEDEIGRDPTFEHLNQKEKIAAIFL